VPDYDIARNTQVPDPPFGGSRCSAEIRRPLGARDDLVARHPGTDRPRIDDVLGKGDDILGLFM
jgi:hypothetical protein